MRKFIYLKDSTMACSTLHAACYIEITLLWVIRLTYNILSGIHPDILSSIVSDISSDILFGILSGI
jgi:hypothetical protein